MTQPLDSMMDYDIEILSPAEVGAWTMGEWLHKNVFFEKTDLSRSTESSDYWGDYAYVINARFGTKIRVRIANGYGGEALKFDPEDHEIPSLVDTQGIPLPDRMARARFKLRMREHYSGAQRSLRSGPLYHLGVLFGQDAPPVFRMWVEDALMQHDVHRDSQVRSPNGLQGFASGRSHDWAYERTRLFSRPAFRNGAEAVIRSRKG